MVIIIKKNKIIKIRIEVKEPAIKTAQKMNIKIYLGKLSSISIFLYLILRSNKSWLFLILLAIFSSSTNSSLQNS
tara:strand:- start:758 stop:982 length:225 start_codon:yes stop_codon:yes gene_type:complete